MTRTGARWLPVALLLGATLLAGACASGSGARTARSDRNLLSTEEIQAAGYSDAFEAVQALRPQWLRSRGATSINLQESVKVYLDGSLLGGPEYLRQITPRSISSIRYLDALEATQRWGLDHGLGAIVVSTRQTP
jgi:hypothetical protein